MKPGPRFPLAALLAIGCTGSSDLPARTARQNLSSLDRVLTVGESLYLRAEYDSARALWGPALEQSRAERDSVGIARLLTWFGIAAWKQGDFPEAHRFGEEALALKQRLGLTREIAKSYNALGLLAWHESRLTDALGHFTHAYETGRQVGDRKAVVVAAANIPLLHVALGEFSEARPRFFAAREAARALGDPRIEANVLTNLGSLEVLVGNPDAAIPLLQQARALYRAAGIAVQEQNALGQLGTAYAALGEPRLALAALDSALTLARRAGLRQEEASDLEALARIYQEAGDTRRALSLYADAKRINSELGLEVETGADLRSEADIHAALGDLDLAHRYGEQALAIHRRVKDRFEEMADLLLLADVADRTDRPDEAKAFLSAARRLAAALDVRTARVDVALTDARIADRRRDSRRVLHALEAAAPDLTRGGYGSEWVAHTLRARAHSRLGQLEQAVAAGRWAIAAVERVRGGYGSGALRTAYLSDKFEPYADLVAVLARLGRVEEAFVVSDAARGRALVEQLTQAATSDRDTTLEALRDGERLLREIDGLVAEIDEREAELADEPDSAGRELVRGLYARLGRSRGEYEALQVRNAELGGAALLGGGRVSVHDVRLALLPGEVLLEYLVTADRVFIFTVASDGVRLFETPIDREHIEGRVRLARDLVGRPGPLAAEPVLDALHDLLVAPAERAGAFRGARRLIVVAHGGLAYLPFAALRDSADGRYLVERYSLGYLPSAAALPVLRRGTGDAGGDMRVAVFAPDPASLPASRDEAAGVSRAVTRARSVVGGRATEARVRRALETAQVVHIAGHGVMSPAHPMFSRIELADGRLEVHEVLGLSLASPLVFLSGCETGLGAAWGTGFARGEDYTTLAQAFLYAGARNVVATLWRVEDEGAAVFAEAFYRQLRSVEPAKALAGAQRELLSRPRYAAPYYWAAYSLSGSGTFVGETQDRSGESVPSGAGSSSGLP